MIKCLSIEQYKDLEQFNSPLLTIIPLLWFTYSFERINDEVLSDNRVFYSAEDTLNL